MPTISSGSISSGHTGEAPDIREEHCRNLISAPEPQLLRVLQQVLNDMGRKKPRVCGPSFDLTGLTLEGVNIFKRNRGLCGDCVHHVEIFRAESPDLVLIEIDETLNLLPYDERSADHRVDLLQDDALSLCKRGIDRCVCAQ